MINKINKHNNKIIFQILINVMEKNEAMNKK